MDYLVVYDGEPIGTMVNPGADPPMGMVYGPFRPSAAYKRVRPVFRLFAEATGAAVTDDEKLARYYQERDALNLAVTTRAGLPVPVAWAHVYDFAQELGEEEGYEGEFNVPPDPLFVPTGSFFDDKRYWDGFDYWAYWAQDKRGD